MLALLGAFDGGAGTSTRHGDGREQPAVGPRSAAFGKLERAAAPRRAVPRRANVVIGRSAEGRPIEAWASNGIGGSRQARSGGPLVLAIGCIHGDECAGIEAVRRSERDSRAYANRLVVVENLNPDGLAASTRLNGNGVDLNRNFDASWRPIGEPGDPEHAGTAPFSEPETRIARALIRRLRPDVTIWFHQQEERLVRAWGPSAPAARTYARLAGEPFRRMPWLDGTAPNWQNHRFRGTSSFVVELPLAGPSHANRHGRAISELAGELMEERDG